VLGEVLLFEMVIGIFGQVKFPSQNENEWLFFS